MNIAGILIICLVTLIALAVLFGGRKYGKLLSPEHISEFSDKLSRIKPLAIASPLRTDEDYSEENLEGKGFRTSQGLTLAYTVGFQYGHCFHHISLSHESGVLAFSAAATFASWIAYLLQIDPAKLKIPVPKTQSIIYVNFDFTEDENRAYEAKNVIVLKPAEVTQELWQQLSEPRAAILEQLRIDPHLREDPR